MFTTPSRAWTRLFCCVAAAAALSACGGGGGGASDGDLEVTFSYQNADQSFPVMTAPKLTPVLQGLKGNTPHCSLRPESTLPDGVTLGEDCRLRGIATTTGVYNGWVDLSVSGHAGTASALYVFSITAPFIAPTGAGPQLTLEVGVPLDAASPTARVAQIFGYADGVPGDRHSLNLTQGSLPPGMALRLDEQGNVLLSGTPTQTSRYDLVMRYTLERSGRSFPSTLEFSVQVDAKPLALHYDGCCQAFTGVPMSFTPTTDIVVGDGQTLRFSLGGAGALPAGLQLDPATGTIFGTPQTGGRDSLVGFSVVAQVLQDGGVVAQVERFLAFWPVGVFGTYPVSSQGTTAYYDEGPNSPPYRVTYRLSAGVPFTIAPGPMYAARDGDDYRFRLIGSSAQSSVPAWLTIDPVTGVISGTRPDATGSALFMVELTLTRGGASYRVNQSWAID